MFNPHIHHQQQQQQQHQQQQFHQHLRQIQQLFQQQAPPPPPQPPPQHQHHVQHRHHHPAPRPMPAQAAPAPRMVNLCQATQTTIIAPNPMLQGALLMQQLQGNMRGFAMAGQQFRQFFSAGARSSLLGPVPMGMTMKSPLMGFPGARHYHPHHRFYNNNNNNAAAASTSTDYRHPDRKRDNEQRAVGGANGQSAAGSTADTGDKLEPGGAAAGAGGEACESTTTVVDLTDEPVVKKPRTEGSEEPAKDTETITLDSDNTADDMDCTVVEEVVSTPGSELLEEREETGDAELSDECLAGDSVLEEEPEDPDAPAGSQDDQDDNLEGTNKFYCYLCSITCHSQQNFRSHMNGISHQQRMMEIQHMSNACLVTLLPRVQESLQAAYKDGEKRTAPPQHWCPSCGIHLTCGATDHRCNKEHKLVGPSCTVCQRSFKSSQLFVEHMRSQEHQHRVHEEKQGFGAWSGMSARDGLLKDPEGGSAVEGEERDDKTPHGSYQLDYPSSQTEVTLERMSVDEEYQADTVYGSRFLVPVAGFLCRLCNKFYHFESAALHSHCKSLTHFEHLKKYKALKCSQQDRSPTAGKSEDCLAPVCELESSDATANPAASSDPGPAAPPVAPRESRLTPAKEVPTQEEEEEEEEEEEKEKLLSQDPSDQEERSADALLAEEEPAADALLAEEEPAADEQLAEEEPAADEQLAEEEPAADEQLAEEEPAADEQLAEEEPAADEQLAEEMPPADVPLAKEMPEADAPLAEDVLPADAPLFEEVPAADAPLAEEVPAADELLADEAPPADALLAEEEEEATAALEEEKEAPEKKTSTGKAKAPPKRRSRRR